MRRTTSPLEFLLVNAICVAGGAVAAIAIQLVAKAAYAAGRRSAQASSDLPASGQTASSNGLNEK